MILCWQFNKWCMTANAVSWWLKLCAEQHDKCGQLSDTRSLLELPIRLSKHAAEHTLHTAQRILLIAQSG